MRVAIAQDWMTSYAGSERVVEELLVQFPQAQLITALMRSDRLPESLRAATPSILQRVPGAANHHEWLLPVMPLAWRFRRALRDIDVVVSSSHACAKAVRTARSIPHVCYCHTPMRYAWDFASEAARFPPLLRLPTRAAMAGFRRWDRSTADGVTQFIANSTAVAKRIKRSYGRSAIVIAPPVRTDYFTPAGERGETFLVAGRLVAYKRPDLVVRAFDGLPHELIVVGDGPLLKDLRRLATSNVRFVGAVSDEELRGYYRSARAIINAGEEDFGIAMAEAQACGTPVIAFAQGGAADIVTDHVTGWLVDEQSIRAIRDAVSKAAVSRLDEVDIRNRAQRFAAARFRSQMKAVVDEAAGSRQRR
jgi:glycosyltransferase involved in cell wall biosynthesis